MILNKKGFTLIELLATVVILSLLVTLGYISVRSILDKTDESYYRTQEDMFILAGKDYFVDYRSKLPKETGEDAYVTLKTLIDENYIEPIKDKKENDCDANESKVTVEKISETEYQYYGLLVCNEYKTTKDETDPVIKFTPNKKSAQGQITITMKVTDNDKVSKYRYVITKNGERYQDSGYKDYTGEVTINLTEIGLYEITGYAQDIHNNTSSKKTGNYSIYDTVNCEQVSFTGDLKENVWYNKDITVNIKVPENTYKYEVSVKKGGGEYELVNTYIGSVPTTMTFDTDGTYNIKVEVYDNNGNSCVITSGTYKIDKTPPSNVTVTGNPGCVNQPATISPVLKATETGSGIAKWQWGYSTSSMVDYPNSASNPYTSTPFSAPRNQPAYFRACDMAGNCSGFASTNICIIKLDPDINFNLSCNRVCAGNCSLNGYNNDRIWGWYISGAGSGIKSASIDYSTSNVQHYWTATVTSYGAQVVKKTGGYGYFELPTQFRFSRSYAKSNIVGTACTKNNKCKSCTLYD